MRYRVRPRPDGVIEIRRRSVLHALFTADLAVLALLLAGWAVCILGLVEALVVDAALTSMVVVLGTGAVSLAVATAGAGMEPPARGSQTPPGDHAA